MYMYINRIYLAALFGFGATLFCGHAQAQSADSTSEGKSHIAASQANESAKPPYKPIRIACTSSVLASRSPLFVVDGKVVPEQDIKSINPNDIDKVDILKSAAATGLYGSSAANGVVIITMKHPARKYIPQPEEKKGRLD